MDYIFEENQVLRKSFNLLDTYKYFANNLLKVNFEESCTFELSKNKIMYMIVENDTGFEAYHIEEDSLKYTVGMIGRLHYKIKNKKLFVVFVETSVKGEGIGTTLLGKAKQIAKLNGCREMFLNSVSEAEGFYEKLGFKKGKISDKGLNLRRYNVKLKDDRIRF